MTKPLAEIVSKCKEQPRIRSICAPKYFYDRLECEYLKEQHSTSRNQFGYPVIQITYECGKGK